MKQTKTASAGISHRSARLTASRSPRLVGSLTFAGALAGALTLMTGCGRDSAGAASGAATYQQTAFRVRADNTAGLNVDTGWAGSSHENVTVAADEPFRLRFEIEGEAAADGQSFMLQSRRNGGDWQSVGAENFPQPAKVLTLAFDDSADASAKRWRVERGETEALAAERGAETSLHARGGNDGLLALGRFETTWQPVEFATVMRLIGEVPAGLVFGYADAANHYRATVDANGMLSVLAVVDDKATRLAETELPFDPGQWFELKVSAAEGYVTIEAEQGDSGTALTVDADVVLDAAGLGLRVAADGEAHWREFVLEGEPRSPRLSVMASAGYRHGEVTTDRLAGSKAPFVGGAGVSFAERTPPISLAPESSRGQSEWEWPLVIRRFADGAVMNHDGDVFAFRMVTADGQPVAGEHPEITLDVPAGHLGGTFVETPGRIGPWQADNGDLYFLMEPAETFNVLMAVKSTDAGRTWQEVDGAHRPDTGDLEGFASTRVGDTIHMVHQTSDDVWYHAFRTSDHPDAPDTWSVQDEWVAAPAEPPTQVADIAVRSDGSIVVVYGGRRKSVSRRVRRPATGARRRSSTPTWTSDFRGPCWCAVRTTSFT